LIIFANGVIGDPVSAREAIHPDDFLIAADGGAKNCQMLGLIPHVVIGDQDSLDSADLESLENGGTQFVLYPKDKDQTDLELALRFAVSTGASEILLIGLLGGRLDQTLANLLLLSLPDWGEARLAVQDGPDTAHFLRGGSTLDLKGQAGDIVSLIPLSPVASGVTTRGLRWPLQDAELSFGSTLGISNEMIEPGPQIKFDAGKLLIVHRKSTGSE
jgi:thiamine pyrophosphokinase